MPINGSRKGKAAEREVATLIQEWWRQLEPDCKFVRTPQSGGWGTPELRGEFKAAGDLMTTAHRFPFTVEVKKREGFSLEQFFAGRRSPVWGWWKQVMMAAEEERRIPMLWFRKNRMPWRVVLPSTFADKHEVLGFYVQSPEGISVHSALSERILAFNPRRLVVLRRHANPLR